MRRKGLKLISMTILISLLSNKKITKIVVVFLELEMQKNVISYYILKQF